jgi:lysophospholipase L1-like esterase
MNFKHFTVVFVTLITFLAPAWAQNCPNLGQYLDLDCDGELTVAVLSDSLGAGVGDEEYGSSGPTGGGYITRAALLLPEVNFINLSVAGMSARKRLTQTSKALSPDGSGALRNGLLAADLVIIDLGRNDRWDFKPAKSTARNLQRLAQVINEQSVVLRAVSPQVVTTVLMIPNRGAQAPWVQELNVLIRKSNSPTSPADLRFDRVDKRLLNEDQIHPTAEGYRAMAKVLVRYLRSRLAIN